MFSVLGGDNPNAAVPPSAGGKFCIVDTIPPPADTRCSSGSPIWDRPTCVDAVSPTSATTPPTQGSPTTLTNPLGTTSISELIARLIKALSGIAGSMALLMFVVGGVMWMTAEESERVGTAQTILKNASIGLVLIFLSYSLVSLFLGVLGL